MKLKSNFQIGLRSMSASDKKLLADWLSRDGYDEVLERVKKPRSEGGFGLTDISKSPLQTFYAKVAILDIVNSRIRNDQKMSIAQFESLVAGDLLLARTAENPTSQITTSDFRNASGEQ